MTNKNKKVAIYSVGGIICLFVIFLIIKSVIAISERKQIPSISDLNSADSAVIEQILDAYDIAFHDPSSENLGMLGMIYHSNVLYEMAEQCYMLAIEKNKDNWIWNYYLGYLNKEMGKSEAAVDNFQKVVEINPHICHAWYYVGEGFQKLDLMDQAEINYKKTIDLQRSNKPSLNSSVRIDFFPLETYAKFQLARIFLNTNRIELAESTLNEIMKEYRLFGPAYRLMGNLYDMKGDTSWSKYYIIRANDLLSVAAPVDTLIDRLALISRSEMYLLKQIDEAERSANPKWTESLLKHALIYLPENKYLISKTINLYLEIDSVNKAIPFMDRHLIYFKDDLNEIIKIGDLLYDKGFYPQALDYYNRAIKLKPQEPLLKSNLAMCLWDNGQEKEALDLAIDLLDKEKENLDVIAAGVKLLLMFGQKAEAKVFLEKLKQLSPGGSSVYKLEGMIAEQEGDLPKATSRYESAFKIDPEDLSNIKYLVDILFRQGSWDKAIKYLREAIIYFPNEPYILERFGTLLVTCEDTKVRNINLGKEFSERAFINSKSLPETSLSAGKSLVIAYAMLNDFNNAKYYMRIVLELARNEDIPEEYMNELLELNERLQSYD
jgi:tetratricopeptide (TPR) repeat protein